MNYEVTRLPKQVEDDTVKRISKAPSAPVSPEVKLLQRAMTITQEELGRIDNPTMRKVLQVRLKDMKRQLKVMLP